MDTAINASEIARRSPRAVAVPVSIEDDLAFFHALWFWIPAGLGLWSAIIWALFRVV